MLSRKPSATVIIQEIQNMKDMDDCLLIDEKTRDDLIKFISGLEANYISINNIKNIDIIDYEKRVEEIDTILDDDTIRNFVITAAIGLPLCWTEMFIILVKDMVFKFHKY